MVTEVEEMVLLYLRLEETERRELCIGNLLFGSLNDESLEQWFERCIESE